MTCLYCDRPAVPHAELCEDCLCGREPLPTLRESQIPQHILSCTVCRRNPCVCRCRICQLHMLNCVCFNVTPNISLVIVDATDAIEIIADEDVLDDEETLDGDERRRA